VLKGFSSIVPADADVSAVADAHREGGRRTLWEETISCDTSIRRRTGRRSSTQFRIACGVELLRRIGLGDLLSPRDLTAQS